MTKLLPSKLLILIFAVIAVVSSVRASAFEWNPFKAVQRCAKLFASLANKNAARLDIPQMIQAMQGVRSPLSFQIVSNPPLSEEQRTRLLKTLRRLAKTSGNRIQFNFQGTNVMARPSLTTALGPENSDIVDALNRFAASTVNAAENELKERTAAMIGTTLFNNRNRIFNLEIKGPLVRLDVEAQLHFYPKSKIEVTELWHEDIGVSVTRSIEGPNTLVDGLTAPLEPNSTAVIDQTVRHSRPSGRGERAVIVIFGTPVWLN